MSANLEMKKCKECGKMFMPTNARQAYCTDVHYRPCPICGDLVEAKYLSDPARRCSKCKSVRTPGTSKKIAYVTKPVTKVEPEKKAEEVKKCLTIDMIENSKTGLIPESSVPFTADEILEQPIAVIYAGKSNFGFKKGDMYIIKAEKGLYNYCIDGITNVSKCEQCDSKVSMYISSMVSFNQNFVRPM